MSFTPCTTGTMAGFLLTYLNTPTMEFIPVEVWDDNGEPFIADELGLTTVTEYANVHNVSFQALFSARQVAEDEQYGRDELARRRSRMSVKELSAAGMSTMRDH